MGRTAEVTRVSLRRDVLVLVILWSRHWILRSTCRPTSMFAVLGAAGLAMGLALKDSLSNIASGVMLVVAEAVPGRRPCHHRGRKRQGRSVSIFQTRHPRRRQPAPDHAAQQPDHHGDSIINLDACHLRRIEIVVGIGYDDDIDAPRRSCCA